MASTKVKPLWREFGEQRIARLQLAEGVPLSIITIPDWGRITPASAPRAQALRIRREAGRFLLHIPFAGSPGILPSATGREWIGDRPG